MTTNLQCLVDNPSQCVASERVEKIIENRHFC